MSEHRDEHKSPFGTTWANPRRGRHAGAFDVDECYSNECVQCNLRGAGKHKVDLTAYTRFYA